ncbi:MAG TPA: hypothetical protein VKY92_17835 [Verrucomicrobiae bacterium]|nr:hypothetical protein [Verrucomicrobiae bacterium]
MSEFKFACPVCGQHITADSTTSGSLLECPTCFQKLIVPQAPVSSEAKLILTAAKASAPRKPFDSSSAMEDTPGRRNLKAALGPLLMLVVTGGAAFLLWRNELTGLANGLAEKATNAPKPQPPAAFQSSHPIPTGVAWTLNLTNASIPNGEVVGSIHGNGFLCERATFKEGRLSLRQGTTGLPDLGITISMGVRQPEDLAGKAVIVTPSNNPAPRVVLRWKDDRQEPVTQHIHGGYAMKLTFGPILNGRLKGRIFIALPDERKSFAAGNFEAEIVRVSQPLAGK